jgi:hypothetical protein
MVQWYTPNKQIVNINHVKYLSHFLTIFTPKNGSKNTYFASKNTKNTRFLHILMQKTTLKSALFGVFYPVMVQHYKKNSVK